MSLERPVSSTSRADRRSQPDLFSPAVPETPCCPKPTTLRSKCQVALVCEEKTVDAAEFAKPLTRSLLSPANAALILTVEYTASRKGASSMGGRGKLRCTGHHG